MIKMKIRLSSWLWVILSVMGFGFPLSRFLILANISKELSTFSIMLLFAAMISLSQAIYIYIKYSWIHSLKWFIVTFFGICCVFMFFIYIQPKIDNSLINISSGKRFLFAGYMIYGESVPFSFLATGIKGIQIGLLEGLILGVAQSVIIKEIKQKYKYILLSGSSMGLGYLLNSMILIFIAQFINISINGSEFILLNGLLGLIFGLFTYKIIDALEWN